MHLHPIYIEYVTKILDKSPALLWNRKEQVILTKLKIRHTKLINSYLITKNEPNKCSDCTCILPVDHPFNCSTFPKYKIKPTLNKINKQ